MAKSASAKEFAVISFSGTATLSFPATSALTIEPETTVQQKKIHWKKKPRKNSENFVCVCRRKQM